jgi:hypothetical protein
VVTEQLLTQRNEGRPVPSAHPGRRRRGPRGRRPGGVPRQPRQPRSYHYTVSTASDGGTTVVDVVDTDEESWSVLSANPAQSTCASPVLEQRGHGTSGWVKPTPSTSPPTSRCRTARSTASPSWSTRRRTSSRPGISDHAYVTKILKDGTHTDVGPNFPWDVFTAAVSKYAGAAQAPAPVKAWPQSATDRELLEYIAAQLGSGDPSWPSKGMTLRDKVWTLGDAS